MYESESAELEAYRETIREAVRKALATPVPMSDFERNYLKAAFAGDSVANISVDETNASKYPVLLEEAYREVYRERGITLTGNWLKETTQIPLDHEISHARKCRGGYFLGVVIARNQQEVSDVMPYFAPKNQLGFVDRAKVAFAPISIGQRPSLNDLKRFVGAK